MIGSNMFSSWEPFALVLHFTGPENNFTLLCNFIYIESIGTSSAMDYQQWFVAVLKVTLITVKYGQSGTNMSRNENFTLFSCPTMSHQQPSNNI
jgi:hypothetical protein